MSGPEVILVCEETLPEDLFRGFAEGLSDENTVVAVESRPPSGPQACLEWFVFPLVAAYVSKPYFESFFGEMGKDHYSILKRKLSETTKKVMSQPRIEPVIYSTPGKVSKENPYTLAFAMYADANDGFRFKLLIPKSVDGVDYDLIFAVFLEFMADYHAGLKGLDAIGFDVGTTPPGGTIFVHVNPATKSVQWLDCMKSA